MRNITRAGPLISKFKNKNAQPKLKEPINTRPFPNTNPNLVLAITIDRFQQQQHQIDALDGKISSLSGFGGVLLAILAAVLALGEKPLHTIALTSLYISAGVYAFIIIGFCLSYFVRKYEVGPDLNETWNYAKTFDFEKMQWWAAESFTRCYENNKARLNLKIFVTKADVFLSTIQAIALIVAIIFAF